MIRLLQTSLLLEHIQRACQNRNLEEDEILVDSIMFRLIQVAENSEKLTEKFKKTYPSIPWRAIKGLRNRIVHEYGNVDLTIVYDTVKKDIPELIGILEGICRCKKE